jgi:hypothetical protein
MAAAPARATPKEDSRHSGKLLLRMAPALHGELARAAEREGMSLNAYITQTLSDSLADGEQPARPGPAAGHSRFLRVAVLVDLVLVAIATVAVVALVIVAWPT